MRMKAVHSTRRAASCSAASDPALHPAFKKTQKTFPCGGRFFDMMEENAPAGVPQKAVGNGLVRSALTASLALRNA